MTDMPVPAAARPSLLQGVANADLALLVQALLGDGALAVKQRRA